MWFVNVALIDVIEWDDDDTSLPSLRIHCEVSFYLGDISQFKAFRILQQVNGTLRLGQCIAAELLKLRFKSWITEIFEILTPYKGGLSLGHAQTDKGVLGSFL